MLDTIEGTLEQVGSSYAEFHELINAQENQEKWLLSELVSTLHAKNIIPGRGECYLFKLPLVLGANADWQNAEVCDFRPWVAICGQIHEQAADFQRERGSRRFGRRNSGGLAQHRVEVDGTRPSWNR